MIKNLFAIGLCAMVAFTSCSKDDNAVAPEEVIKGALTVDENFDAGVKDAIVNTPGWSIKNVKGEINWTYGSVSATDPNKYPQATAFKATPVGEYETWLVSAALNVRDAKIKTVSFETSFGYWNDNTSLEVYVMTDSLPEKAKITKIDAKLPTATSVQFGSYNSGNIDLSKFTGKIFIGFKYKTTSSLDAATNKVLCTTFRIDNFKFGIAPAKGDIATDPLTIAEVMKTQDKSIKWTKGFIVGFAVSGKAATTIKTSGFAIGDVTNLVLAQAAGETNLANCIVVKLMAGTPRTDLGLGVVANAGLVGKEVAVRGNLESSFGQPGMINVAEYVK